MGPREGGIWILGLILAVSRRESCVSFWGLYTGTGQGGHVHWDMAPTIRRIHWRARIGRLMRQVSCLHHHKNNHHHHHTGSTWFAYPFCVCCLLVEPMRPTMDFERGESGGTGSACRRSDGCGCTGVTSSCRSEWPW